MGARPRCSTGTRRCGAPLPWRSHARPVRDPRLRGDAAADAGGARGAALRGFLARFPTPRRWRRRPPPTCCAPGAGSATTAARSRCGRRRRSSPSTAGRRPTADGAAGRRPVHGRRGRSFAWDAHAAAVDTNVAARDRAPRRPSGGAARARAAGGRARAGGRAAAWNQAMMELGATVCRPRARPRAGSARWRRLRGAAAPGGAAARPRGERFEDTDRWARGRLLGRAARPGEPLAALAPGATRAGAGRARARRPRSVARTRAGAAVAGAPGPRRSAR